MRNEEVKNVKIEESEKKYNELMHREKEKEKVI
jgi:hypothetical protein